MLPANVHMPAPMHTGQGSSATTHNHLRSASESILAASENVDQAQDQDTRALQEDLRYIDIDQEIEDQDDVPTRERKRKRNKPTLSCGECVERKTKVGYLRVEGCR